MARPKKLMHPKTCPQCKQEFSPGLDPKARAKFKKQKHCSQACMWASYRKTEDQAIVAFWERVDKSRGPNACWPYTGAITTHGYGCTLFRGRVLGTHKVAYLIAKGDVPDGMQIRHSCHNPPCCNPAHLSIGTREDNARDRVERGQFNPNPRKLTADAAREIRELKGKASSGELAARFGISQSYVFGIWAGKAWRNA